MDKGLERIYRLEIEKFEFLSPEKRKDFTWFIQQDTKIRNEFIVTFLKFVVFKTRYARSKYPELSMDIIQQGNIGLMRAYKSYDPNKGIKFHTYASRWILQNVYYYLSKQKTIITTPQGFENHDSYTKSRKLQPFINQAQRIIHIDECLNENNEPEDKNNQSPLDILIQKEQKEELRKALNKLNERDKKILLRRFGFNGECETLEDVAKTENLSMERIRQIQIKAIEKTKIRL